MRTKFTSRLAVLATVSLVALSGARVPAGAQSCKPGSPGEPPAAEAPGGASGALGAASVDLSSNNYLESLSVPGFQLVPSFSRYVTDYAVHVPSYQTSIDVTGKAEDPAATVRMNQKNYTEGADTVVYLTITAEDGSVREYKIRCYKDADPADNWLEQLSVAGYQLTPSFSRNVQEYAVSVPYEVKTLDLSWKTSDANAKAVVSGNNLTAGSTVQVTVKVTSLNGSSRNYVIKAYREASTAKSSENRLTALSAEEGALTPSFSPDRLEYALTVPHDAARLNLSWTLADPKASVNVYGNILAENAVSTVTVGVTAEDGSRRLYEILVTRPAAPKSADNYLASLQVSGYSLTPAFSPSRLEYSVSVPYETVKLGVSCVTSSTKANVLISGNDLTAGTFTDVTVTVTAENGARRVYVIKASRAAGAKSSDNSLSSLAVTGFTISPTFTPDRLEYSVSVPFETTSLAVSYHTSSPLASVSVSGNSLAAGAVTSVRITVTAENGQTRSYVIKASRQAASKSSDNSLMSLTVPGFTLSPSFSPGRLEYSVSVPYETTALSITYQTSSSKASAVITGNRLAENAPTPVTVTVTAENGETRLYVIKASRAPAKSQENRLAQLSVAGYPISPSFSPDRTEYTVNVESGTSKLVLNLKTADPKAALTVSGNTLAENAVTAVTVKVTAENGAGRVYTIKAFRASAKTRTDASDSRLASLIPSCGALTPAFSKNVMNYTVLVPGSLENMSFSAAPSDSGSSVSFTQPDSLEAGTDNLFTFTVTSGNGSVSVYTVAVRLTATAPQTSARPGRLRPWADFSASPELISLEGTGDTMIFSASLLNSLFRTPGSSWTASNPVGQVSVTGEGITGVALPYYNLTLSRSTPLVLPEEIVRDALVVSTGYEGELFGQVELRVFCGSSEPLHVYLSDPASGALILIAGPVTPDQGAVSFRSSRAGTFILCADPMPGTDDGQGRTGETGFLKSYSVPILTILGLLMLFCLAYLAGAAVFGRKTGAHAPARQGIR